jgi:hypothetical protein
MRWRLILPTIGLLLFAAEAYESNRDWKIQPSPRRYFYWSSIRLDSDPMNRHRPTRSGDRGDDNKEGWDLHEIAEPRLIAISSILSGLPAFLASMLLTTALSRLGVSQVLTFMVSTAILLFTWYYFFWWLLDRWRRRSPRGPVNT